MFFFEPYLWKKLYYGSLDDGTDNLTLESYSLESPKSESFNSHHPDVKDYLDLVFQENPPTTNISDWKYLPQYHIFQLINEPTTYANYYFCLIQTKVY